FPTGLGAALNEPEDTTKYLNLIVYPGNTTVGPVSYITVTTSNANGLLLDKADVSGITVVGANGSEYYCTDEPIAVPLEGNDDYLASYSLPLNKAINTNGTYTITIPAGYFESLDADYDYIENNDTTVVFTLAQEDITYTFTPESESTVGELSVIEITNVSTDYLALADGYDVKAISIQETDGTTYGVSSVVVNPESYVCTITLDEAITTVGTYTLRIPAGFFYVNEAKHTNGSIEATYTIGGFEITPADGSEIVGHLDEVIITSSAKLTPTSGDYDSYEGIDIENGVVTGIAYSNEPDDAGNYTCTIYIEDTELGECTITIPAGFFVGQTEEITATYTIVEVAETAD
ncbi:MAG: hypothetical protein LUC22_06175, partial [Prevotella sp.]|nr:hypothetical protein [Prevotella sp.]